MRINAVVHVEIRAVGEVADSLRSDGRVAVVTAGDLCDRRGCLRYDVLVKSCIDDLYRRCVSEPRESMADDISVNGVVIYCWINFNWESYFTSYNRKYGWSLYERSK